MPDDFEHDLAYWFFPAVRLQYFDHDLSQSYYYANPGVPYTVRPVRFSVCDEDKECMEIRYALAYRRDFGDSIFGTSHLGDSEFYAAIVQRTAPWSTAAGSMSSWQMIRDFTSAHWGENIFDFSVVGSYGYCATSCSMWDNDGQSCNANPQCDFFPGLCSGTSSQIGTTCSMINNEGECFFAGCSWQDSDCYSATTCYSTVPLAGHRNVYAATRKHSNYHSDAACDAGAYGRDECQTNQYNLRNAVAGKLPERGQLDRARRARRRDPAPGRLHRPLTRTSAFKALARNIWRLGRRSRLQLPAHVSSLDLPRTARQGGVR